MCLVLLILLVYALFPTRNYYWDGVGFALAIEDAQGLTSGLFNPNHRFYSFFGYLLYQSLHWATPDLRALWLLSICSILFSIGTAYLLFSMLMASLRDSYSSVCLTLLFAFSATWWKFSTDANAYVPSVFFLLLRLPNFNRPVRADPRRWHTAPPDCSVLLSCCSTCRLSECFAARSQAGAS